jgi:molecular chaperone DnaJ
VEIHIKPHAVFQREGDDLHCEMPISFTKAALGGEIEVPTLNGGVVHDPGRHPVGQDLPPERQGHQGRALRLRGRPVLPRGIETPVKLTEKQKELLREFEKSTTEGGAKHSPQSKTWKDKVKDFLSKHTYTYADADTSRRFTQVASASARIAP